MFFSISKSVKDNFVSTYPLGDLFLNVDSGWHTDENSERIIFYKGYSDKFLLSDVIDQITSTIIPELTGNLCCIRFDKISKLISLRTDKYRSFPIFIHEDEITNLKVSDNKIFSNFVIDVDQKLQNTLHKFNLIGTIETHELPVDEVIDKIDSILAERTKQFLSHNTIPIKTYMSGGVDSLLVFTYLNRFTKDYEIVKCQHLDYDKFWMLNSTDLITNFWGYEQIHHWMSPTILTSGAPGDEFMLRSPYTVNLLLEFYNLSVKDLLLTEKWKNSLHSEYFHNTNIKNIDVAINNTSKNKTILCWNLCNNVINDWQHWHLGETLTWTPLRDLEIFKLILQLPLDDQLEQSFDSGLSKKLIENNFPGASKAISEKKNRGNVYANLYKFYSVLDKQI
jgi:hypothetical protein